METTLPVAKLRELLALIDDQDADVTLETLESILEELEGHVSGDYVEKYLDQIKESMTKKKKLRQIANVLADVLGKLIERRGGSKKVIKMPVETFVAEHKNLLNVLKKGSKKERLAEAADQAKELKQYTGKGVTADINYLVDVQTGVPVAEAEARRTIANNTKECTPLHALGLSSEPCGMNTGQTYQPPTSTMTLKGKRYDWFPDEQRWVEYIPQKKAWEQGLTPEKLTQQQVYDIIQQQWNALPKEEKLRLLNEKIVPLEAEFNKYDKEYKCKSSALCSLQTYGKTFTPTAVATAQTLRNTAEAQLRPYLVVRDLISKDAQTPAPTWFTGSGKPMEGGAIYSANESEHGLGALVNAINTILINRTASALQADAVGGMPTKIWNGHTWYLDTNPVNDEWGNPPGYWLRTDLTLQAVESYKLLWEVLAQFPDGTLKLYKAPWSKAGLDSVYVDDDARRDLRQSWDAWAAGEHRKAWNGRPKEDKLGALNELIATAQKAYDDSVARNVNTPPALISRAVLKANYDLLVAMRAAVDRGEETNVPPGIPLPTIDWSAIKESLAKGEAPTLSGGRIPEQFSTPVRKVLEEVSFGPPNVLGSSGDPKSMYSADYDLLEYVPFHGGRTVKAFQKKIATLASKYCITDIKCGENPDWNVLTTKTYNREKERTHLRRLWQEKVITDAEYKNGEKLLKEHLTKAEKVAARKELRFGVWRWTPADVARGYIEDRLEKTVRLEDAMKSPGITKVDLVVWIRSKYAEVSNIILWTRKNSKTYAKLPNVMDSLREDVAIKVAEGKYFKVAKRLLSIARNRGDVSAQENLYTLLNSHLGHISTVVSDLTVLKEFPECVSNAKKRQELDELRDEMAKLYYPEFMRTKSPERLLPALEVKLHEEAKKKLEELGYLPLKDVYKE